MIDGVRWYTEGIARFAVYFPEGKTNCRNCRFCHAREAFGNFYCRLADVYIQKVELDERHKMCPIEFIEEGTDV